jgi:hypothetical protein
MHQDGAVRRSTLRSNPLDTVEQLVQPGGLPGNANDIIRVRYRSVPGLW